MPIEIPSNTPGQLPGTFFLAWNPLVGPRSGSSWLCHCWTTRSRHQVPRRPRKLSSFSIGSLVAHRVLVALARLSIQVYFFTLKTMFQIWFSCWQHHIGYDDFTTDGHFGGWVIPKREAVVIHFIQNSSNLNCQLNMRFPFLSSTQICTSCKMHNCAWNLHCRSHHTDFESQLGSITLWCKHFTWHWHASHMWWISIPRHHVEGNCCHFSKPYVIKMEMRSKHQGKPCWKCHVMLHCYMSCQTFEKVKKGNSELDKSNFSKKVHGPHTSQCY